MNKQNKDIKEEQNEQIEQEEIFTEETDEFVMDYNITNKNDESEIIIDNQDDEIDKIESLDDKVENEEDKYIKLTPRRFYTSIIVAPILVFIVMITIIMGGSYVYAEVQLNKQVDTMIQNALDSSTSGESVDAKLAEDMIAVIDYEGSVNGKTFDGGSGEDFSLVIGSETFVDGFEDQLIGYEKGDKVKVTITFPDDYTDSDLAGKKAVYIVTINDVQKKVEAKLNDDFVQSLGISDVTTVDQLKSYLKDYLQTQSSSSTN